MTWGALVEPEVSPVVHTLATKQFDDYVKRVRIFTRAESAGDLARLRLDDVLAASLREMA